jgi:hypothetical protein
MPEHVDREVESFGEHEAPDDHRPAAASDEQALLAAFERLSPQGSLRWGFDDAMRRIAQPETDVAAAPWPGLPDDLWERGRSARIGRRFVGDVAGVMAELLAADARATAAAAAAGVNVATWDALRYLAARVEALETAQNPVELEAAELPLAPPDLSGRADVVGSLLGTPQRGSAVIVGECGDGAFLRRLQESGWQVEGVEPRAAAAWRGLASDGDGTGSAIVVAEVLGHLGTVPPGARAGVVLAGCVDRLGLATKVGLLGEAVRVTRPGGAVVVLATDQSAWDEALDPRARDLAPGRPLHPETWSLLCRRSGLVDVAWHRPGAGALHAVVGRVPS